MEFGVSEWSWAIGLDQHNEINGGEDVGRSPIGGGEQKKIINFTR